MSLLLGLRPKGGWPMATLHSGVGVDKVEHQDLGLLALRQAYL